MPPGLAVEIPAATPGRAKGRVKDPLGVSVAAQEGTDRKAPRGHQISAHDMQNREVEAILHVMRGHLKAERTLFGQKAQNARKVFRLMDRDGNGVLDRVEFKKALTRMGLGLTEDQVDVVMRHMDKDMDAHLDYEEFLAFIGKEFDVSVEAAAAEQAAEERELAKRAREAQRQERLLAGATEYDQEALLAAQHSAILRVLDAKMRSKGLLYGSSLSGELEDFFAKLDQDGSGDLSTDEFGNALRRLGLGLSDTQIEQIVAEMDTNGDGRVNFEEFYIRIKGARPAGYGFAEESESVDGEEGETTAAEPPRPKPPEEKRPTGACTINQPLATMHD